MTENKPVIHNEGKIYPIYPIGVDLRDWFAGQALVGLMQQEDKITELWNPFKVAAEQAYQYADAMMAAREVKNDRE